MNSQIITVNAKKNGNAVVAVKKDGKILWSWHIWACEGYNPDATAQKYNNNAGVVMDRNLGATSATPGKPQTIGLLYQWGRKDPFLSGGKCTYEGKTYSMAASTITDWHQCHSLQRWNPLFCLQRTLRENSSEITDVRSVIRADG